MPPLDPHVAQILDSHAHPTQQDASDDEDALLSSLENDPSLTSFREQRLQQLHTELSRAKNLRNQGYGTYTEIKDDEKTLMEITTGTKFCVVHFFKDGFQKCAVMDRHLEKLAPLHLSTRFLRISVTTAPFLVTKLQIKVLPCVIAFIDGISVDRIIGFEGLGYTEDTFTTRDLEARLLRVGVLVRATTNANNDDRKKKENYGEEQEDGGDDDEWD